MICFYLFLYMKYVINKLTKSNINIIRNTIFKTCPQFRETFFLVLENIIIWLY